MDLSSGYVNKTASNNSYSASTVMSLTGLDTNSYYLLNINALVCDGTLGVSVSNANVISKSPRLTPSSGMMITLNGTNAVNGYYLPQNYILLIKPTNSTITVNLSFGSGILRACANACKLS